MNELPEQLRELSTRLRQSGKAALEPPSDVRRRARLRRAAGAMGVSLAVIVAGIGGYVGLELIRGVATAPHSTLAHAAAATKEAGTARFDLSMSFSMVTGEHEVSFEAKGEGAYDLAADRYALGMKVDSSGALGGPRQGMEVIRDGATLYMKNPMPGAKPWIASESALPDGTAGFGAFPGFAHSDPSQVLDYLRKVTDEIEIVGTEMIRGEKTTHYRATVDMGGTLPDDERAGKPLVGGVEPRSLPIDVWVDSENRLRKVEVSIDVSGSYATRRGIEAEGTVVFELYGFGAPVDIEVPAADQVERVESPPDAFDSSKSE